MSRKRDLEAFPCTICHDFGSSECDCEPMESAMTDPRDAQTAPELLPCPFCGEAPETMQADGGLLVCCDNCLINMLAPEWNRRADTPARAGMDAEDIAKIIRDNLSGPMFDEPHIQESHNADILNTAKLILAALQPGEAQGAEPVAHNDALLKAAQIAGDAFYNLPAPKHWDRDKKEYGDWCQAQSKRVRKKIVALANSADTPAAQVTVAEAVRVLLSDENRQRVANATYRVGMTQTGFRTALHALACEK